jgi:hypothetical protein
MKTKTMAHLIPSLLFGGILGIVLVASGASLGDAVLALCGAYALVSLLEVLCDLEPAPPAENKR